MGSGKFGHDLFTGVPSAAGEISRLACARAQEAGVPIGARKIEKRKLEYTGMNSMTNDAAVQNQGCPGK